MCETGAVSRAALRLGVNHSTVLRRLQSLEAALGVVLFERGGSYVLTRAGRDLLTGLGGASARIEGSRSQLQGRDDEVRGEVRLTTTDTLAHSLLMPLLSASCGQYGSFVPWISIFGSVSFSR